MLGSALSIFSEPGDFEIALEEGGGVDLIVTGRGEFWARLARISLFHMRLFACEERLSRIAFMSVAADLVRITLPSPSNASLICGGIGTRPGEIVTHSAGHRFHERTDGPIRWSAIWIPTRELVKVGRAIRGSAFLLPPGERRWRPSPEALRCLVSLHTNAIRATATRPKLPVERDAARGLAQQLVTALIECLNGEVTDQKSVSMRRHAEVMIRFQEALPATPVAMLSVTRIARSLGVSNTLLRTCCQVHLGMAPSRYLYLRRMRLAREALRHADPDEAAVARIARLHGFGGLGHFASAYRALFGELPSATLRRASAR